MSTPLQESRTSTLAGRLALGLAMILFGACAGMIAVEISGSMTNKRMVLILGVVGLVAFMAVAKQAKNTLLFFWVVALTYNRQFYSFDGLTGNQGSAGLYYIPSDLPLVGLFLIWAVELVVGKASLEHRGLPFWRWWAPFYIACLFASLAGEHPVWGFCEMARQTKILLFLLYLRYNLRLPQIRLCLYALAFAILVQSLFAVLQVTMNVGSNVMAIFGSSDAVQTDTERFDGESRFRAAGTMVHPNVLGPFLLLVVPMYVSLMFAARTPAIRLGASIVSAAGLVSLVGTMSRMPCGLAAVQITLVLAILVCLHQTSVQRAVGSLLIGGLVVTLALIPLADRIVQRLTGDFSQSISFRKQYNEIAVDMWEHAPMFGIGLNHFSSEVPKFARPGFFLPKEKVAEEARTQFNVRAIAPVHNVYLLILAETGVFGLAAFCLLLFGGLWRALVAISRTQGEERAICVGVLVGILGEIPQQALDFSLWMDPALFTFALFFGITSVLADPRIAIETGNGQSEARA